MSLAESTQHVEISENSSKVLNPVKICRNAYSLCEELLENICSSFAMICANISRLVSVGIDRHEGSEHFSAMRNSSTERSDFTLLTAGKNQQKMIMQKLLLK